MPHCCSEGASKSFSKRAAFYARKYRRRGLDAAQRGLLRGLVAQGIKGLTVLDIGSGVGGLHLELLKRGATSAVAIDTAPGMIEMGRELASENGLAEKVSHRIGDFVSMADETVEADVVVMDKVLCCYPEPAILIRKSARKVRRLYALSFPRHGVLARIGFGVPSAVGRILRWSFYPFYHDPRALVAAIREEGFHEVYAVTTFVWQIVVFRRMT